MFSFFKPNIKKLKSKGQIKELINALSHKDSTIKSEAEDALICLGKSSTELLIPLLNNSDLISLISDILVKSGNAAVPKLLNNLSNEALSNRVIDVLLKIGELELDALIDCLIKSSEQQVSDDQFRTIIDSLGPHAIDLLIESLDSVDKHPIDEAPHVGRTINILCNIGESAVLPLIANLEKPDSFTREKTIDILGIIKDGRSVQPLIKILKKGNENEQGSAAIALGRIGDESAVNELLRIVNNSESKTLKDKTILALAHLKYEITFDQLLQIILNGDGADSVTAVEFLGELEDVRAYDKLLKIVDVPFNFDTTMTENEKKLIATAAYSLGKRRNQSAVDKLTNLFENSFHSMREWEICRAAATALGDLGNESTVKKMKEFLEYDPFNVTLLDLKNKISHGMLGDSSIGQGEELVRKIVKKDQFINLIQEYWKLKSNMDFTGGPEQSFLLDFNLRLYSELKKDPEGKMLTTIVINEVFSTFQAMIIALGKLGESGESELLSDLNQSLSGLEDTLYG